MCQYFRVIKSARRRGPRLVQYLSILLNNRTKTTPKYLSRCCFRLLSRHCTGDFLSTHVLRSLEIRVGTSAQRKYTELGCMCRCIICKYGNLAFSYSRFFCSIITHHMHIVSYVEHSSATNPPGVQFSKHSHDRLTISNFRFLSFYYLYNNKKPSYLNP
jgi:hypothetical protein